MTTQEPLGWNTLVVHPNGSMEGPFFESWMTGRPYGPQERFHREGGLGAPNLTQTIKNDELTGERSLLCYSLALPSAPDNHVASMMMDATIQGLALVIWEVME